MCHVLQYTEKSLCVIQNIATEKSMNVNYRDQEIQKSTYDVKKKSMEDAVHYVFKCLYVSCTKTVFGIGPVEGQKFAVLAVTPSMKQMNGIDKLFDWCLAN